MSRPPSHAVERLISELLPKLPKLQARAAGGGASKIVGAEWWVHTRAAGRHLGHQLHFDTDEVMVVVV